MKKTNLLLWLCLLAIVSHAQPPANATRAQRLRYYYLHPEDPINKDKVWIMAHRGIWDEETPESSLGAFQNAIDYKFEIAELDVRFSAYIKDVNGNNTAIRDIILQHDKSDSRSDGSSYISGLFKFDPSITFDILAKKKSKSGLKFIALNLLQPLSVATSPNKNCIVGTNGVSPTLIKFDGTTTQYKLIHFPNTATTTSNTSLKAFYDIVKDNILINLDKMKDDEDFQETYDLMNRIGLIDQCIFKGKGLTTGFQNLVEKFGGRALNGIMFTPIFTKYDYLGTDGLDNSGGLTEEQKFQKKKLIVDDMLRAEQAGVIVFPGCEIVYEEENDWLTLLAEYVNSKGKRVIQFSVIPENKQGVWAGNLYSWETFFQNQNYWSWIFDDTKTSDFMKKIKPSVMVGDKGLEFRSYLNSLMKADRITPIYNQTPIN